MNLVKMLTSLLTSGAALEVLASKTGLSKKQLSLIISVALPLLIKKMTSNASSKEGAASLLGALGQHKDKKAVDKQLKDADEEDGAKIVGHILGSDQDKAIASIAKSAGVKETDVAKVLGSISPSVLNGLSAATASASKQKKSSGVDLSDGFDMTDVMGLMGGGASASQKDGLGLSDVIGLFGNTSPKKSSGVDLSDGFDMKDVMGLLGGGGSSKQQKQEMDGTALIGSLLSMMK